MNNFILKIFPSILKEFMNTFFLTGRVDWSKVLSCHFYPLQISFLTPSKRKVMTGLNSCQALTQKWNHRAFSEWNWFVNHAWNLPRNRKAPSIQSWIQCFSFRFHLLLLFFDWYKLYFTRKKFLWQTTGCSMKPTAFVSC